MARARSRWPAPAIREAWLGGESKPRKFEGGGEEAMDFSLSGNALKTFARSVTCLARVGTELVLQASPSQVPVMLLLSLTLLTTVLNCLLWF